MIKSALVLDLSATPFMDSSASLAIEGVIRHAASRHQPVFLVGVVPAVERVLAAARGAAAGAR